MFLNKAALITTLSLFLCSACVSLGNNKAQQIQISNLQTKLVQVQETHQQTQHELTTLNTALATCQNRVDELANLLEKNKLELQKTKLELQSRKALPAQVCPTTIKWDNKTVLGQTEWVYVSKAKKSYRARIDTGAATSSINAADIEPFERDGKKWVRFNLNLEEGSQAQIIEAKIRRIVRIAQSTNPDDETERRFVVKLHVRIGNIAHYTEFTLTDRSHMDYPILIGRSFMQDVILVDVSKEYIHPQYQAQ
ncbi:MAG: ATP-dependent zinc protease [Psychromonas sp.]|nr:ATP-dependent zinc protease [Psychromonas sp.]